MKKSEELHKKWAQIVAKAWMDPQFKSKLIAKPQEILKEHGLADGQHVYKIIEAKKNEICFVLPAKPEGNLSDSELRTVAAAGDYMSWYS